MSVKNDFPNIDSVLRKLRDFVRFFEQNKGKKIPEEDANEYIQYVEEFITDIEKYLDSVCNDQKKIEIFKSKRDDSREIQEYIAQLDDRRSLSHTAIIMSMISIDRVADLFGLQRVFDYAEEFEKDASPLLANNWKDKRGMDTRAREKRREMGNFGLYIAAGVTVGLEMSDKELRDFASCETEITDDKKREDVKEAFNKVSENYRNGSVKKNMDDMLI